jgi:hypothetical protein
MASMNPDHSQSTVQAETPTRPAGAGGSRGTRIRPWLNWTLALLAAPAAVVVVLVGLGVLMSYASCSDQPCVHHGPSGVWLEVLWFGSPVVAAVTIAASFFTAERRYGIVLPLCGWALIVADVGLLALYTQH